MSNTDPMHYMRRAIICFMIAVALQLIGPIFRIGEAVYDLARTFPVGLPSEWTGHGVWR